MKLKTAELTGLPLNWAVAKVEGRHEYADGTRRPPVFIPRYSSDWSEGGPIIDRERINLRTTHGPNWQAVPHDERYLEVDGEYGPTPLIAAMRCHVARHLGVEVDVPEELVTDR